MIVKLVLQLPHIEIILAKYFIRCLIYSRFAAII